MKSKFKALTFVFAVLLVFGTPYLALAKNATDVDVKISYPYGKTEAVARATPDVGDVVNIYITLLDEDGNPATAGPGGEAFADLEASITSNLGADVGKITTDEFLIASGMVAFDSPEGPAARAYADYTDALLTGPSAEDIITVTFLANPGVSGTAGVNVVAAPGAALQVRTYGTSSPSLTAFNPIGDQLYNNGNSESAGSEVDFWVIADDGNGNYTLAPELDGAEATVRAYADFSADGGDKIGDASGVQNGINHEASPIAEANATFLNGIAQGTIAIGHAGPSGLDVVLTAMVSVNGTTLNTTEMVAGTGIGDVDQGNNLNDTIDDDVDYVRMIPGGANLLLIGEDPYTNGNLILPKECYYVADDGASGPTNTPITVFQTDTLGNAVEALVKRTVNGELKGSLDGELVDSGGFPGSGVWDIAGGDYSTTDYLADYNSTTVDNDDAIIDGSFELTSPGLTKDSTEVTVLPGDGAGGIDLTITTDADVTSINAGSAVTMNITAAGSTLAVESGDDLMITATGAGEDQLLSDTDFEDATTSLLITASDEDDSATGMQISFLIFGPCTPTTAENVTVTMTNQSKCGISADNSASKITDIQPGAASKIAIKGVATGIKYSGTLKDNPIVITSEIVAGTKTDLLEGDGTTNDLQTADEFENTVNAAPDFTCASNLGIVNADYTGPGGVILDVTYPTSAIGQTDTITCGDKDGLPSSADRQFEIGNIVGTPTTGEATALEVVQEGPQDIDGVLVNPSPCGEAIIRIGANGTSTGDDRNVEISLSGIPDAELRKLNGDAHTGTVKLLHSNDYADQRLVVSAPALGDLTITASDETSSTALETGTLVLSFGPSEECIVTIEPPIATVLIEQTKEFTASTECDGEPKTGDYTWEIIDQGCTGTSIDPETGVYTAGSTGDCTDTIKVTDTVNRNASATATVNVSECEPVVTVTCESSEVGFGLTTQCSATTTCDDTDITETYTWSVTSDVGSSIDENGLYTAGNEVGTDTVTATGEDTGVAGTAEIDVASPVSIEVTPASVPRSRWVALPALMNIKGTDTSFDNTTTVEYESALAAGSVIKLPRLVFPATQRILQIIIVMPTLLTRINEDETITVTVTTGTEEVEGTFEIKMLPFILDEKKNLK